MFHTIHRLRLVAILLLLALAPLVPFPSAYAAEQGLPPDAIWIHTPGRITALASGRPSVSLPQAPVEPAVQAAPNGSLLAFAQLGADGRFEQLVGITARSGKRSVLHEAAGANILQPVFAPDSRTLAFSVVAGEAWQLKTLDLRSGQVRVLQQGALRDRMLVPVAWTPGGLLAHQILWASDAPAHGFFLVNATRGTLRTLSQADHWQAVPSGDGKRIAFVSGLDLPVGPDIQPDMTLSILNVETGRTAAIVRNADVHLGSIAWAPDRSKLLYVATDTATRARTLHVVNADGSGDQTLTFRPARQSELRDVRWRDSATVLLLVGGADGRLHLYEALGRSVTPAGLKPIGTFAGAPTQAVSKILYVPR